MFSRICFLYAAQGDDMEKRLILNAISHLERNERKVKGNRLEHLSLKTGNENLSAIYRRRGKAYIIAPPDGALVRAADPRALSGPGTKRQLGRNL